MKISGYKFIIITVLILLIPVYGNWELLLKGEKTVGTVIKTKKESMGQLLSFYSIIEYKGNQQIYHLKGPENIEYPKGKEFPVIFLPNEPTNAIIFTLRGVYLNRFTSVAAVIFILWVAFYLSFTPKNKKRKSETERFTSDSESQQKKLN